MSEQDQDPTREEIDEVLEQGGPWITITFTSEDQMFEQKRVLNLAQAEDLRDSITAEIAQAKRKYNRGEE